METILPTIFFPLIYKLDGGGPKTLVSSLAIPAGIFIQVKL
jgi:hypothetical protein